jgi:hypothetical protein
MQDRLREIHGQKPQSEQSLPGWMTNIIIQSGRESTAFPNKGNPATSPGDVGRDFTTAEARVMRERAAWKAAHKGQEPDPDMVRGWAADELAKQKIPGTGIFGTDFGATEATKAKIERTPEYQGKLGGAPAAAPAAQSSGSSVPPEFKASILAKWPKGEPPPTEDELGAYYTAQHPDPERAAPAGQAPGPAAAQKQADTQLVHPVSQSVLDEAEAKMHGVDAAISDFTHMPWHQQNVVSKKLDELRAGDAEAAKSAAGQRAELMRAHPGWKPYKDRLVAPDGRSIALP